MTAFESGHDHNGALVIDLSTEAARALAAEDEAVRDGLADLRSTAEAALRTSPSYIRIRGLGALPPERVEDAFRALSSLFGDLIEQDSDGTVLRRVEDRGTRIGEGKRARYADSRFGGSLHTDGAELPQPVPSRFALLCVRQAATGGELNLVHIARIEQHLAPEVRARLRAPFHFDRRGDQAPGESPTALKEIIFDADGGSGVTYLREYVELGHRHEGVPELSDADHAALDALDAVLRTEELWLTIRMEPGEAAVFDNLRLLHGRTTFEDDAGPRRLLLRTWIRSAARLEETSAR